MNINKRSLCSLIFFFCFVLFLFSIPARAAIPEKLNIQGIFTKNGQPAFPAGDKDIMVYFYDSWNSNTPLLDLDDVVPVDSKGFFSLTISVDTDPPAQLKHFTEPLWVRIETKDENNNTISFPPAPPWQPLTAAPYAITAKNLVGGTVNAVTNDQYGLAGNFNAQNGASGLLGRGKEGGQGGLPLYYGVAGVSGKGPGVHGQSYEKPGGAFSSRDDIGVKGVGAKAGGSFESESIGVNGKGTLIGGTFQGDAGYGVVGFSKQNHGVFGVATAVGKTGVYGGSDKGYGVYGKGSDAGGYFEAANANGVIGKGSTGVFGEGTSVGLLGNVTQTGGAGVKARNTTASGAGAALEVEGPLKSDAFSNNAGTVNRQAGGFTKEITANASATGRVAVTIAGAGGVQDTATIKIKNSNFTTNSFIIVLVNGDPTKIYEQDSGYFSIKFTTNGTYTIKYLVIKV